MDTIISYNEVAALIANSPTIAPRPNFTNLHNHRCHIQCALMRVSCPQRNILGWAGLIMSRAMYGLLTTSPFRTPTDLGPLAIYNPAQIPHVNTQGDPVLNGLVQPTYQAQPTIDQGRTSNHQCNLQACKKLLGVVAEYLTCSLQLP